MNFKRKDHPVETGFYIVFGSIRRPTDFLGGKALDWSQPPIGVYQAETAEQACIAAAKDHGTMATYFAVPGTPWGLDMVEAPAKQLGRQVSSQERLADALDKAERRAAETDRLVQLLEKEKGRELTREERIAAAERRSEGMEREAGIGDDGEEY